MSQWIYRSGAAPSGQWDVVSVGASDSDVTAGGWAHTGIRVATTRPGQEYVLPAAKEERIVVPLAGGPFTVDVAGEKSHTLRGRASVFDGPSDVLFVSIDREVRIAAHSEGRLAVVSAPTSAERPTAFIPAEDTPIELRGAGVCSRQVHNFGTPSALDADRLIVCEVITPSGNWSSYPAHKHDENTATETQLEEIYYFESRVNPDFAALAPATTTPFGLQHAYGADERELEIAARVTTGDTVLIPYGWHGPSVAAPGYDLYYLNVMAGPGALRDWLITDDPEYGWLRKTWETQELDPRLPFRAS